MDVRDELEATVARPAPARDPATTPTATNATVSRALVARAVADPSSAAPSTVLELQRLAGNASVRRLVAGEEEEAPADRSPVLDVVGKGGGQPLAPDLRSDMEGRLGADFGDVRLHTDSQASRSAEAVNAHAYTVGSDVVFRSDRWNPDSSDGRQTLAHELVHVVQQRSGPVDGTATGDGVRVSDPHDSYEQSADRTAAAAMTGPVAVPAAPAVGVSREEDEEEEGVQTLAVSREQAEEEDEEQAAT
ncbi:MAG TPA: DUF4157 domain-containing protein [Candidatus Limnocylindrales bacterium]